MAYLRSPDFSRFFGYISSNVTFCHRHVTFCHNCVTFCHVFIANYGNFVTLQCDCDKSYKHVTLWPILWQKCDQMSHFCDTLWQSRITINGLKSRSRVQVNESINESINESMNQSKKHCQTDYKDESFVNSGLVICSANVIDTKIFWYTQPCQCHSHYHILICLAEQVALAVKYFDMLSWSTIIGSKIFWNAQLI